jgi:hypothetical protein
MESFCDVSHPPYLDRLSLFASDEEIGEAVLGRDRRREFGEINALLKAQMAAKQDRA